MFNIVFGSEKARKLIATIDALRKERDDSEEEARKLRATVADLKHEQKIAEEDIKHMVRLREEKLEVEFDKKNLERDRTQQEAIADIKDEYRDKLEARLQKEVESIKEMYAQILERLPKVQVRQFDSVEEKVG